MPVSLEMSDTIAAIASPPLPSLRGIVRVSGPRAHEIVLGAYIPEPQERLPARGARVSRGRLRVDGLRTPLPVMLGVWHAPRTYTGQDLVEIHLAGAVPLVNLALAHCLRRGARHALPGEFTLRAFLSGRMDLTRAEAVLGVIEASNPAQMNAALEQLAGGISRPVVAIRDRLLDVLAHMEANLDFADEADVDGLSQGALARELSDASATIGELGDRLSQREHAQPAPRVVLVGPPNAGKSRLFNALVRKDRAIVSPQAGTTRDYLSAPADCCGLGVELVDTAGIETGRDPITLQAQAQRRHESERAEVVLRCQSADTSAVSDDDELPGSLVLEVWTKGDQSRPPSEVRGANRFIITSAHDGTGLDELRAAIASLIRGRGADAGPILGTGARCRASLLRSADALAKASETLAAGGGDELVSVDLRTAVDELGTVVGAVVTDDILDRIFSRFCIGK